MIRRALSLAIICLATVLLAQSPSSKWQSARVLEVKEHSGPVPDKAADPSITRYDVSMQVKDTEYLLLYTPRPGSHGFQYVSGMDILVLVKDKTITFNDILGRPTTVPIVSKKPARPKQQTFKQ